MQKAIPFHRSSIKKDSIIRCCFFSFFILMLIFPKLTLKGATEGLLLWFNTLLPVLLPFLILSGIIIRLNIVPVISSILYPFLKPFFRISKAGAYPVFLGFLSGLPAGAKTASDLTLYGKINKKEGSYVASLCNNASPMFIINYVAVSGLHDRSLGIPLLFIVYISAGLSASLTERFRKHLPSGIQDINKDKEVGKPPSVLSIVDSSITDSFEIVTKIGGYIILFSILSNFLTLLPLIPLASSAASGILEISTGINHVSQLILPMNIKFMLTAGLLGFGGFCALLQTQSVLSPAGLPVFPYFISKLLQGILAALLAFFYFEVRRLFHIL